jgi:hypothetical protein
LAVQFQIELPSLLDLLIQFLRRRNMGSKPCCGLTDVSRSASEPPPGGRCLEYGSKRGREGGEASSRFPRCEVEGTASVPCAICGSSISGYAADTPRHPEQ